MFSWPAHVVRWHATWKMKCNQKWLDETAIRTRGIISSEYLNIWCLSLPLSLLTLTPALGQSTGFLEQFSDGHDNAFSKTHHPLLSPWVYCYQQSQSGPVSCHLFWVDFSRSLSGKYFISKFLGEDSQKLTPPLLLDGFFPFHGFSFPFLGPLEPLLRLSLLMYVCYEWICWEVHFQHHSTFALLHWGCFLELYKYLCLPH